MQRIHTSRPIAKILASNVGIDVGKKPARHNLKFLFNSEQIFIGNENGISYLLIEVCYGKIYFL